MDAREGNKKTNLRWIPESWNVNTLDQLANILMGQSPSSKSYNGENTGLPLIQGNADITKRVSNPRIWTSQPTKTCEIDDILMTVRAPVGAVAKSAHKACIGRGVCAIRPTVSDASFLFQTLISFEPKWRAIEQGSTFTAVNGKDIKSIQILTPPLPEQQKIAEILTSVDDKIASIEDRIQQTEQLKKGLMEKLLTEGIGHTEFEDTKIGRIPVGWGVFRIGEIGRVKGGKRLPKGESFADVNTGLPYIRAGDLKNGTVLTENVKYLTPLIQNKIKRYTISSSDTYITIVGAYIGDVGVIPPELDGANLTENAAKICDLKKVSNLFLAYFLNSNLGKKQIQNSIGEGAQPKLALYRIENILMPIPDLFEQKQIAIILSTVDDKLDVLHTKKTNYETLKKGLMEQLLTGKMRVKP